MFVKKDLRKIPQILSEGKDAIDTENEENKLEHLRLGRRPHEFQGSVRLLCQPKYQPALQYLQTLSLYDSQISSLEGIGMLDCCPQLCSVNVGRNPIREIPDEIEKLAPSLKELLLDDCALAGPFPSCLLKLENLEILRMSNNQITTLPADISLLSKLQVLAMDRNQLTRIPSELQDLTELKTLLLRHNQIRELPDGVPGPLLLNLTLLHISSNQLITLPDTFVDCPILTHVYANGNQLKELPFGMDRLSELQRLNLSHNRIDYLPTDFIDAYGEPDQESPEGLCVGGKVRTCGTKKQNKKTT